MSWLSNSSIGRKLVMGISGLFLVLFLLFHSLMNFVALISPEAYNDICAFLGANWYALIATVVLAAGIIIHIVYSFILSLQNLKARGSDKYAVNRPQKTVSWQSKNMLVLGLIILGFIVLHMYQFWAKMQLVEILHMTGVSSAGIENATNGSYYIDYVFSNPLFCVLYLVWFVAIWYHLTHGIWSGMQTLGWSNNVWLPRIKRISYVFATIIFLLFAALPLFYLFGGSIDVPAVLPH